MRFSPREKGKTAFVKEKPSTKAVFPFSRGKNRIPQKVENRGSLISVPLALRVITVRAEIITELMLKREGPVIFKTFLLELIAFRPIPVICPARGVKPENYWKR